MSESDQSLHEEDPDVVLRSAMTWPAALLELEKTKRRATRWRRCALAFAVIAIVNVALLGVAVVRKQATIADLRAKCGERVP